MHASALLSLALFAVLANTVSAHYTLTTPAARGTDEDKLVQAPCGGFNSVQGTRADWPLGQPIQINAEHANSNFTTYLSLKPAPAALADFQPISNALLSGLGKLSVPFPLTAIPAAAAKALSVQVSGADLVGKTGTIMTTFDAGDGVFYQCGDVTFLAAAAVASSSSSSSSSSTTTAAAAASSSPTAASGKSGAVDSRVGSSVIGMASAAALVALVL
ncbi:hypothetical protein BC828DRAFT_386555 [Blastocladiella britannica]|nr:hypothetical protein BC828DRAFT_386555 [Blastocladiella britannica]